jgi:hypothetical protein
MPPDRSDGKQVGDLRTQAYAAQGLDGQGLGLLARDAVGVEQAEGDVLPDRQAVEQGRALEQHADPLEQVAARPFAERHGLLAVQIDLAGVGRTKPRADLMVTDLPWPEPPMITSDRPGATLRSSLSSTGAPPLKRLDTPFHCSLGAMSVMC